jgi:hypothetical protein
MKKLSWALPFLLTLFIMSCGPSHKVTSSWISPEAKTAKKKYSKVFIVVLTQNQAAKNIVESDLEKAAQAKGFQTVKSSDVFAPNFTKDNGADKATILAKVRELGCDAILTSALVKKESEQRYVPGSTSYMPYGGYGGYGFGGYYGYMYPTMYSTPGYYTTDKTYFIETNLFDVASENMIYSVQSEAYDPSNITSFSRDYTAAITDQFVRDLKAR